MPTPERIDPRTRAFGWIPDIPDQRDKPYNVPRRLNTSSLPPMVDLSEGLGPVLDQGNLGSCTANAIASHLQFNRRKQGLEDYTPSRLFVYYNERVVLHTEASDSGAVIRDGIKSVSHEGVCRETEWPYKEARFKRKPNAECYTHALSHQVLLYQRIYESDLGTMHACLAEGFPFVFGFTVYDSFLSQRVADTGIVPMPKRSEAVQGGHAVLCIGYDEATHRFKCRNSWSEHWGDHGNFYMPYQYLGDKNLSDDFWTIRLLEKERKPRAA